VADLVLTKRVAELAVILPVFGEGLHFSPRDRMAVRAIALPGALGPMAVAMPETRDPVAAGAMLSILANPLLRQLLDRRAARKAAAWAT
jgi:predicted Kef-type K+ transport protein